jgi:uncharacterized protein YecT (DUF1311 family)
MGSCALSRADRLAALAIAALLAAAAPARADDLSPAFQACAAKAHGATYPMLHCYAAEMQARDDAMDAAYAAALKAATDPRTKKYLTASQIAWSDYRDAWCEATVSRSGSLARLRLMRCRLDLTATRTAALATLAGR